VKLGPRQEVIAAAEADLKMARAELAKAQWRLEGTVIRAPGAGTILAKKVEQGEYVNPRGVNPGSICELADLTKVEVDLTIQERDLHRVFAGQKCAIRLDADPKVVYEGSVSRLMPVADRARGALPVRVRIQVPKDDAKVRPEMRAIVSFLAKE